MFDYTAGTLVRRGIQHLPSRQLNHAIFSTLFKTVGAAPREALIHTGDDAVLVGTPNVQRVHQFSRMVGAQGTVLILEPDPRNREPLEDAASDYDNVTIDERGAWSSSETKDLLLADDSNSGDNKIEVDGIKHDNDFRSENYIDSLTIQVEPLDSILAEHELTPDFIEIMVNGAELEVLQGATAVLRDSDARLLVKGHAKVVETGEPINTRIAAHLEEFGYRTIIGPGGDPTVGETDDWQRRAGDVYAWK